MLLSAHTAVKKGHDNIHDYRCLPRAANRFLKYCVVTFMKYCVILIYIYEMLKVTGDLFDYFGDLIFILAT